MSEHKIEDTNPPLARRAVRPFVGPAGAAAPAPCSGRLARWVVRARRRSRPRSPHLGPR